jgi:hypothetical protein
MVSLLLTIVFIYQVVVQSLHFHFLCIENTKKMCFGLWHLIFWVHIIDLDTCMERFHLIRNSRIELKVAFLKSLPFIEN